MTESDAQVASSALIWFSGNEKGGSEGEPHRPPSGPVVGSGYSVRKTFSTSVLAFTAWISWPRAPGSLAVPPRACRAWGTVPSPGIPVTFGLVGHELNGTMQFATMLANPMSLPPIEMVRASTGWLPDGSARVSAVLSWPDGPSRLCAALELLIVEPKQ